MAVGEIRSKCTDTPKYVKRKSKKGQQSGSAEAAAPADDPDETIEVADSQRDMFVDLIEDHGKKFERINGSMESAQAQGSGGADEDTTQVQDDWILQGEYLVRRHFVPRTTLFSPGNGNKIKLPSMQSTTSQWFRAMVITTKKG